MVSIASNPPTDKECLFLNHNKLNLDCISTLTIQYVSSKRLIASLQSLKPYQMGEPMDKRPGCRQMTKEKRPPSIFSSQTHEIHTKTACMQGALGPVLCSGHSKRKIHTHTNAHAHTHTWSLSPAQPFISLLELSIVYQKPGGDRSATVNLKSAYRKVRFKMHDRLMVS